MIMHTPNLLMTQQDLRKILSSPQNTYVKHGERKVTKWYIPDLFEMEMPGFYLIGGLEEAVWFLLGHEEV